MTTHTPPPTNHWFVWVGSDDPPHTHTRYLTPMPLSPFPPPHHPVLSQAGDDKKLVQAASRKKKLDERLGLDRNAKGMKFKV